MKTKLIIVLICFTTVYLQSANQVFSIKNPTDKTVENVPVVLKSSQIKKIAPTKLSSVAVFLDGKQISSQADDLNKDGIIDEVVFLIDLKSKESKKVTLKTISEKKRIKFPAEVYADLIVKEADGSHKFVTEMSSTKNDMYNKMHHHGVAFESTLMAYRIYFDNKSTIDIYGKKKPQLEIAATGWYPSDEQLSAGYGDDILLVSGWVGVGTVKGFDGKKMLHIEKFDKRTQRILTTGNLRTIVESEVEGWQYEGKKLNLTVRYTLYARHRDAICEITASDDINQLATGVQQIGGGELLKSDVLVGSWGTHYPQPDTVKYAKETAGLGVYVPEKYKGKQFTDGVNNLIVFPVKKGETVTFHFTAAWLKEENTTLTTKEKFFAYLKEWSSALVDVEVK
jgi:hypothetical protein